jgi:hypothetical protein
MFRSPVVTLLGLLFVRQSSSEGGLFYFVYFLFTVSLSRLFVVYWFIQPLSPAFASACCGASKPGGGATRLTGQTIRFG